MSIRFGLLVSSAALFFGPPSVTVEVVTNPDRAPIQGAVLMVTGRHHGEPAPVTGRAEGLVAGKRISRPLTMTAGRSTGLYGVTRQWESGQPWVLVFTVAEAVHDSNGVAEAMVPVGADGRIGRIESPMGKWGTTPWPRRVTQAEIDAALERLAVR
jgi:hypothetical protein